MSALQWACHLRSRRHIQAVERGVDPIDVLRAIQIELAVLLAAGEEERQGRGLDPRSHVEVHAQLKVLRMLVSITLDLLALDQSSPNGSSLRHATSTPHCSASL